MAIAEVGNLTHFRNRVNVNNPDYIAENFGRIGEFSPSADISFEKHIGRLKKAAEYFKNENGARVRLIVHCEPLWYGLRGR